MSLEDQIMMDLKEAMKKKETARVRTIRAIKAELQLKKTDGSGIKILQSDEVQLIQKMVKKRQDSLEIYMNNNRPDLASIEKEEIDVLKNYLPQQLSQEEIQMFVKKIVEDNNASGMKDMGKIMGIAAKLLAGKADNKSISIIVKQLLNK